MPQFTSSRLFGKGWAFMLGEGSFSSFLYSFCSRSTQGFLAIPRWVQSHARWLRSHCSRQLWTLAPYLLLIALYQCLVRPSSFTREIFLCPIKVGTVGNRLGTRPTRQSAPPSSPFPPTGDPSKADQTSSDIRYSILLCLHAAELRSCHTLITMLTLTPCSTHATQAVRPCRYGRSVLRDCSLQTIKTIHLKGQRAHVRDVQASAPHSMQGSAAAGAPETRFYSRGQR